MEFLVENWKWLVSILLIIVETVLVIVLKKRPQLKDNSLIANLMIWIDAAEKQFKLGTNKKDYVIAQAKDYLGDDFDEKTVSYLIEEILSLPQKKEKKDEK